MYLSFHRELELMMQDLDHSCKFLQNISNILNGLKVWTVVNNLCVKVMSLVPSVIQSAIVCSLVSVIGSWWFGVYWVYKGKSWTGHQSIRVKQRQTCKMLYQINDDDKMMQTSNLTLLKQSNVSLCVFQLDCSNNEENPIKLKNCSILN